MVTAEELNADEEEFHSSYRLFVQAVEMLAAPAEEQCMLMGDYNVAWELKDDVAAGAFLVGRGHLTPLQEAWVQALVGSLNLVDVQLLASGAGREASLVAMSHVSWEPLRVIAALVLDRLAQFTDANSQHLGLTNA